MDNTFSEDEKAAFEKVDLALSLIALYAPDKFSSFNKDVSSIYVTADMSHPGSYRRSLKLVRLRTSYVTDPETTHQDVACCLFHEAQHGRLRRWGFGYEEEIRTRIERICMTAERNFARKLPGCEELVECLEDRLETDWAPYLSNEALWRSENEAKLQSLKDFRAPGWIIIIAEWKINRNSMKEISSN